MTNRVINFNAGPATRPFEAIEFAQRDLLDFENSGMSVLEHSHRGKEYERVHNEAIALIKELLAIPDNYDILFYQGGASAQFVFVPMNLIPPGGSADYVLTGHWATRPFKEANIIAKARAAADVEKDGKFLRVPKQSELNLDPKAAYVHITSNNTIEGTQFFEFPDTGSVPLVADMSSDIMWRSFDVSRFGLFYAGAQKNLGPAGVTLVVIRKDLVEKGRTDIPVIFRYSTFAKENSLFNTPPCFSIYMLRNVLKIVKERGGLSAMEKQNREKARLLYGVIDAYTDYYRCPVEKDSRSVMTPVFRLPTEELEAKFIAEAKKAGMVGLKGHRSVGGCRACMYNAMTPANIQILVDFMDKFRKANPA
jgi:phosphoserine aminotransferase